MEKRKKKMLRMFQLLLLDAEKSGQIGELLAITDTAEGYNIFHYAETEVQLRLLLGALDRLELKELRDTVDAVLPREVPRDIAGLITSFLPPPTTSLLRSRLLHQVNFDGYTPLTMAIHKHVSPKTSLAMFKLLVEAGADPRRRLGPQHQTAMELAWEDRHYCQIGHDIIA